MSSDGRQGLLGQPLEMVQARFGVTLKQQRSADGLTDFYLHGVTYLQDLLPVTLAGIISILRQERCVALRLVFDRQDVRYASFVYTQAIARQIFERVTGSPDADWQPLETTARANGTEHLVYCLGDAVATTWEAASPTGTIASDVIIYREQRCASAALAIASPPSPVLTTTRTSGDVPTAEESETEPSADKSPIVADKTFPDINGNLYEAAILKATNRYRLVAGYEDGTFKPERAVTREQAITLLLRAMNLMLANPGAIAVPDEITTAPFADVSVKHRSARQFYYAKQAGILAGDDRNNAYPDATLSRAGLMTILRSGLQVVANANYRPGIALSEVIAETAPAIAYIDIEGHWGANSIRELTRYGIATPLNEQGQEFAPAAAAQRDFTTAALVRLVELPFQAMPDVETKPAAVKTFPDIGTNPYKEEIIKATNQYGIVAGYADGKFHPTDNLSREQAVTLLINALTYRLPTAAMTLPTTLSDPPPFEDVTAGASALKIQFAKEANLVSGDQNGWFRPLDKLSRAQLMAMIHGGLSYCVRHELGADVPLLSAIAPAVAPPAPFSDVPPGHWAYSVISDLLPTGIVTADAAAPTDTQFQPEQPVHRDYAAAAMVRLVEAAILPSTSQPTRPPVQPEAEPTMTFTDLAGNPYEPEIQVAANIYRLVSGYDNGEFRPQLPASRELAVVLLLDALRARILNKNLIVIPETLTTAPFADVAVNRWSAPKLAFAKQAGIIAGDRSGRFFPDAALGRAQLMAIAYQALSYGVTQDFGRSISLDQIFNSTMVETYNFVDVPNDHWVAGIMPIVSILGLAEPQDLAQGDRFAPDAITRRDYTVATAVHMIQLMYTATPEPVGLESSTA
ncbi:MAG: S-layer homology domain-containing protein [Cyanobacteria bacterium P01_C01_bin.120]